MLNTKGPPLNNVEVSRIYCARQILVAVFKLIEFLGGVDITKKLLIFFVSLAVVQFTSTVSIL